MKHSFLSIVAAFVSVSLMSMALSPAVALGEGKEEAFKKERRIFLWDVTISMVGATRNADYPKGSKRSKPDFDYSKSGFPNYNESKDIFDATRETLVKMICQIENESTEIIVLPFRNGIVGEFKANATVAGKEQLKNYILGWNDLQPGGTFTATCLNVAVDKYFKKDKINRLFLLTDGEPSNDEGVRLLDYLNKWHGVKETKGSSCYLVYIMLTDEAEFSGIGEIANGSGGDITVVKEFEEPVWLSINNKASIYIRDFFNGKIADDGKGSFEVPYKFLAGTSVPENSVFHFCVEDNDFVDIDAGMSVVPSSGKFVVPFRLKMQLEDYLSRITSDRTIRLNVRCSKDECSNKNISITGNDCVNVELVIKSEPRVKISWTKKQ